MNKLTLDFETYSEADLKKVGSYQYAKHPSTEALMLAWKIDYGMTHLWDIASGEPMPERLAIALCHEGVTFNAFNAQFERLIFRHVLNIELPIEQWRCSMCRAYSLSFTGTLDQVLSQFVPQISKDKRGTALIRKFSKPQPKNHNVRRWTHENAPEEWQEFKDYCIQDVEAEYALAEALEPYPYLDSEQELYTLDQKINDRGVPVDPTLIKAALEINEIERARLMKEMKELTGLSNPNSRDQLLGWLNGKGLDIKDLQKATISAEIAQMTEDALDGIPIDQDVYDALLLKQQLAKASVTKWKAFDRCKSDESRIHGMFQFAGASRTNRWAGRLVQLQNLARGGNTTKVPEVLADAMVAGGHELTEMLYGDVMMALSDTLRCAITSETGEPDA